MSRRRKVLLVALVLGSTAFYALWRAPEWGARLVEHLLGRYFNREVQVQALVVRWSTAEVELRGLRVAGSTKAAPPFLEVPVARVRPSLAPVHGNRIVLSRVRVEGLRLRIRAFPSPPLGPGGDDLPKIGGGGARGGGLQVDIRRLVIVGGEFILNHERVPLDLDLPDFQGRLAGRPQGGLAGHVSFGPGILKMGAAPELSVGTDIDVVVHRGVLDAQGAPRGREDEPGLSRADTPRRPAAGAARLGGAGGPRRPREARLPLRPGLRGHGALERPALDRRVAPADRGTHERDGRILPGSGRPALRGVALLRRHVRPGDARPRRGGPGRLRPAGHRRAARGDPPPPPHPRSRAGRGRRGGPPHDLRLGRDAPRRRRHRPGRRELAPRGNPPREREDRSGSRRAGGRAAAAGRAPRLARGGRAADLRARPPRRPRDEGQRHRRGGRGRPGSPRGRGGDGGPRRDRGGAHPRTPGPRQPRGPARRVHRPRDLRGLVARHRRLAGVPRPLRGGGPGLRRGRLGASGLDGHPRHGFGVRRVAAAPPAEGGG